MRVFGAGLALLLMLAGPAFAERMTLTGQVTYRERIALPPNGSLSVNLIDLATPATPTVAARATLGGPGQVPLTFTLHFEDSVVLPGHAYALTATIADESGAVWFTNATPYPVEPLAPAADILLILSHPEQPAEPAATPPAPTEPVADLPPPPALPPIVDTTWRAVTIGGNPVADNVVSSLSVAADMRAGGKGGCNSWFAQAQLTETQLVFSAVAATRMACLSDAATAQEDTFFAALAATRSWRLAEDELTLVGGGGEALAVLEKSPF
jgi:putative lipoprotein